MNTFDIYANIYRYFERKKSSVFLNSFCVNYRNKVETDTHYYEFPIEYPYHIGYYFFLPALMAKLSKVRGNLFSREVVYNAMGVNIYVQNESSEVQISLYVNCIQRYQWQLNNIPDQPYLILT